jgi:hypothetical protein
MKKTILTTLIVIVISLALAGVALAQTEEVEVVKGQVMSLGAGVITIESVKDGAVVVTLPADFDVYNLKVGDTVMVKGTQQSDGSLLATTVRVLGGNSRGHGQGGGVPDETGKPNSAFCADDKQDRVHPMAEQISEKYGVTTDWVMSYYCNGQSIGAIMLALKTSQLNGSDPASTLALRAEGVGWGHIWQSMGMIGSETTVKTPPGKLKKP